MKKNILIGFAFFYAVMMYAMPSSFDSDNSFNSMRKKEEIRMKGSLRKNSVKSVFSPIRAFFSISELDIDFLSDVGSIDVVVYNESGNAVYQKTVNTPIEHNLTIDVSDWELGNYEIRFVSSEDQFMYGEFEID
jgi:hypothetical protein